MGALHRGRISARRDAHVFVIVAIAVEDLERSTEEKTAAVHFLCFELLAAAVAALRAGAGLSMGMGMGIDDARMPCGTELSASSRAALVADFAAHSP